MFTDLCLLCLKSSPLISMLHFPVGLEMFGPSCGSFFLCVLKTSWSTKYFLSSVLTVSGYTFSPQLLYITPSWKWLFMFPQNAHLHAALSVLHSSRVDYFRMSLSSCIMGFNVPRVVFVSFSHYMTCLLTCLLASYPLLHESGEPKTHTALPSWTICARLYTFTHLQTPLNLNFWNITVQLG